MRCGLGLPREAAASASSARGLLDVAARLLRGGEARGVLGLELRSVLGLPAGGLDGLLARCLGGRPAHRLVVEAHGFLRIPSRRLRGGALRGCRRLAPGRLPRGLPRLLGRVGLRTRTLGLVHREGDHEGARLRVPGLGLPAQLRAHDLAARGLRQLVDERDLPRVLVRRGHVLHVLLQLADQVGGRVEAMPEHDERLHDLAAIGVGRADHRALGHRRMLEQRALDLERADPVRRREDHVVRATDEPEVALLVRHAAVAGHVPAVAEDRLGVVARIPVPREQRRRPAEQRDVALHARAADLRVVVDHRDVVTGRREPHRARTNLHSRRVGDEQRVLGLAVPVVHRDPERVLEALDHLGVERLAGGDRVTEPREVRGGQAVELREQPVLGRRLAEHCHAEPLHQAKPILRIEGALVQHDLRAARPGADQHVPDRLRPAGPGGAPDDVLLVGVEPVLGLRVERPRVRVGVDDPTRLLRRPRRVEDQRALARRRVLGRRAVHVPRELASRLVEIEHRDR